MRLAVALLGLLFAVSMTACAEKPATKTSLPVEINTALKLESNRVLTVHYTASAPVQRLEFSRSPDAQRTARWTPVTDEFQITHEDGVDYVSRIDGEGFSAVTFQSPITYTVLPKDYAPYMPYSDGGVLLHSGRFQVCPAACMSETSGDEYPMQLSSNDNGPIILKGEVSETDVSWIDSRDGTMVYVGRAKPIETDHVIAIIDPKLPIDIKTLLNALFPEMMDYFAVKLGTLEQKPMLFAALDRDAAPDGNPLSNNFSSQGGTLPGQVFMHLAGDGWLEPLDVRGDYAGEFLAWFFAHEAAHLYQRASDYNSIEEDAWIHEGSAEAFAAITMQELELASDASIETRKTQSVEKCLEGLKQGDLRTAGSRQDFDLYYSCGMVIQLAVHKAVQSKGDEKGIFLIWEEFLEAQTQGKSWNESIFMSIVEEKVDRKTMDIIGMIIEGNSNLAQKTLMDAIR